MYIDALHRGDNVITWCRNEDRNLIRKDLPAIYSCYRIDHSRPTARSIYGDPVSEVTFDKRYLLEEYADRYEGIFESDIQPIYKTLSKHYHGMEEVPVNIGYFDIEVDYDLALGKGFPTPDNPYGEVNSFSLFDSCRREFHMAILADEGSVDLADDEYPVIVHYCNSERQLLDLISRLVEDIDILSAWHGDGFDIPYLVARYRAVFGKKIGDTKLCRDGFSVRERVVEDDFGNISTQFILVGRVHLDLMRLYKTFTFGERASYKLDYIAEQELGEKKLEYKGDLGDLYRRDKQTFFEYSLHDARLLLKMDNKRKLIDTAVKMARQATVKFTDVYTSIKYLEMAIRNYCHHVRSEKLVLPNCDRDAARESFEGGYVFVPDIGAHGWSCSIDLTSLYPSVIRALNISPETHLLQCLDSRDDLDKIVRRTEDIIKVKDVKTGKVLDTRARDVSDLIKDNNLTISANGSIFAEKQGIIPEILTLWFEERKYYKQKSKEAFENGDDELGSFYDVVQALKKLNLNSVYGCISNVNSRFFSLDCAKSITMTRPRD